MYSGWPYPDPHKGHPPYETSTSITNEQSRTHAPSQIGTLQPRSLESRPPLQTSLSEPSGLTRSQHSYRYTDAPASEYRSGNQNLPGLRDILNSGPFSSAHTSYGTNWNTSGAPPYSHHNNEGYYNLRGVHPPMVLHPPTTANQGYQPHLDKPYESPNFETKPPQVPLSSPRSKYLDGSRDFADSYSERPQHAPRGSISRNGVPSPYSSAMPDEPQHRTHTTSSYRQQRTPSAVTSADSHGKYLGVKDVAGEGQFHIYEDGFRIPTQVDGEQVNPAWGLTKANKPRKRLALACLDCREKKIKCDPGVNSCVQCEKAMRTCRKAPEKYSQTDTSGNTMWVAGSPVRTGASEPDTDPSSYRNTEPDSINKRRARADVSPPLESSKRQRSLSPRSDSGQNFASHRREETSPTDLAISRGMEDAREQTLMWENDPYAVAPEMTLDLLDLYFAHVNNGNYCIVPRRHFLHWLKSYPHKCQNEKMVLYAMLAAASIYADGSFLGFGKQCAQVAGDAVSSEGGRFNVAAAQSKMLLAIYHFSKGAARLAWDYAGSAIRTVTYMNLNTEEGCKDDDPSKLQSRYEFALSPEQLAECKRRTFWACFLQDRYCEPTMCMIKPEDIFVRLPCTDDLYERGVASDAPYFYNDIIDPAKALITLNTQMAPLAWHVLVAAIWGDIIDFTFRVYHKPDSTYREAYESFYTQTENRLQDWLARVPKDLQYNEENLDRSIQQDYVGTFISMHTLYHLSIMKLNRYMRHAVIPDSVRRNIRTANHHGHQVLQIMTALSLARREITAPAEGQLPVCAFSAPFPGYATLVAIDIVTAGGLDTNIGVTLDSIDGSLPALRELSQYWNSAKSQLRISQKRLGQLQNITTNPKSARSGCWIGREWGLKGPLDQEYPPANDCIYGLGEKEADEEEKRYFHAFK